MGDDFMQTSVTDLSSPVQLITSVCQPQIASDYGSPVIILPRPLKV